MARKLIFLTSLILAAGLVNSASAIYLALDIAYPIANPEDPNHLLRNERTAEPGGWFIWASNRWRDLSYHDPVWAGHPSGGYYPLGIAGTGVDAFVRVGYEGDTSLKCLGMTFMGDGTEPVGIPPGGNNQICNSWIISHRHWGDEPNDPNASRYSNGSVFITMSGGGFIKGNYSMTTYHNCPNNIAWDANAWTYPPDWYIDDGNDRIMPTVTVYGPGVIQKHDEETHDVNVVIQSATNDDELIPSVVKWYYNGTGDVTIMFRAAPGGDYREGGAAVMNAFILEGGDPGMATFPRPSSGATDVHPAAVLKWKEGLYAAAHDVYFSTNFDDVNDSIALVSDDQEPNEYDPPGLLTLGKTYYWRIDEVNVAHPNTPWRGMIWEFTIDDGKAGNPLVEHGDLPHDVNLVWTPGTFAVTHDLYLGTDFDDVNDGDTTSDEFIDNLARDSNSYEIPYLLELGKSYYWRVDEHNSVYGNSKGDLWSFQVQNYLVIDDFESYNLGDNLINDTWVDGLRYLLVPPYFETVNGAMLFLGSSEAEPPDAVHGGKQAMYFAYDNTGTWSGDVPYYSEAERVFDPTEDLSRYGLKALVVYFHGDPNADISLPENQMYMKLGDSQGHVAKVDYGQYTGQDMNHLNEEEWHEWNIDLEDFNSAGVEVTDVNKIIIGFGDRNGSIPGGVGDILFDDMRLYLSRCVASIAKPLVDLSGNCEVDFADVRMVAEDWLEADLIVPTASPAAAAAHYEFDETSGVVVHDSSLYGRHGTVVDGTAIWDSEGKYNGCLNFDETYGVSIPPAIFGDVNEAVTISVWANGDADQPDHTNVILQAGTGVEPDHHFIISIYTSWQDGEVEFATGYDDDDSETWQDAEVSDWAGEWKHYAFVSDTRRDFQGIYYQGRLVSDGTTDSPMAGITVANIGTATDHVHDQYIGRLDDLRIYNYGLSDAEIAYIASEETGILAMRTLATNLYNEEDAGYRAINFKDFALIAESWLERIWWP